MARALHKLNPRQITAVKNPLPPGMHSDGGGLYLVVDKPGRNGQPGAKRFAVIYQFDGKRRELGLGSANDVTLERARELAAEARQQVAEGVDPKAVREVARLAPVETQAVKTFGAYALEVIAVKRVDWKGRKTEARWLNAVNNHCAAWANKPVDEITTEDVMTVLTPLWARIPAGAMKTQEVIEAILDSAKARGLRTGDNPARWLKHLDKLLPKRRKLTRGSHAAMLLADVAGFMSDLRDREGIASSALELLVLTGARTTEVREATWGEFDLEDALWSIPRDRVKEREALERARITHKRIPLSPPAVAMLQQLRADALDIGRLKASALVFPGPKSGIALSENGMSAVLARMGVDDATVHGFRSTFRDWAGEQRIALSNGRKVPAYSFEACEISLGHTVGNATTTAYLRGDLLDERRDLIADWGLICAGEEPDYSEAPSEMSRLLEFLAQEPHFAARWAAFQAGQGGVAA